MRIILLYYLCNVNNGKQIKIYIIMLDAGFLQRNLLECDVEIDYTCMSELSYEFLGSEPYIELYVNDFYIGILPIETDGDNYERYNTACITINNEIIYLEDITNRKPNS